MPEKKPTSPKLVAFFRGLLEAAAIAALGAVAVELGELEVGELAPYVPFAFLALRQIEGFVDEKIDPTKQRGRLGGAPAQEPPAPPL